MDATRKKPAAVRRAHKLAKNATPTARWLFHAGWWAWNAGTGFSRGGGV